ncbi:MAG: nitrile hydratase subunit beta [Pseudohongiellaceae bacterium]
MKGGHDLGGKHGLGPIDPEAEATEPVFHADWERRVFAMTMATGMLGKWNIDESRHARECQHPADYLGNSYYENWFAGIQTLLTNKGLVSEEELAQLNASTLSTFDSTVPTPEQAMEIIATGGPSLMSTNDTPLFKIGDSVRAKKSHTAGHSRLPAYVQGSAGIVEENYGCHIYPDKNSQGQHGGEFLYRVRFSSESLWGQNENQDEVLVDLWQPYLEEVA